MKGRQSDSTDSVSYAAGRTARKGIVLDATQNLRARVACLKETSLIVSWTKGRAERLNRAAQYEGSAQRGADPVFDIARQGIGRRGVRIGVVERGLSQRKI